MSLLVDFGRFIGIQPTGAIAGLALRTGLVDYFGPSRHFLRSIKALGFKPRLIYDIGANRGRWTRSTMKIFPDARYVLFEPQETLKENSRRLLSTGKAEWRSVGLSDVPGSGAFTIHTYDLGSRFDLSSEQASSAGHRQVELPLSTIDSEIGDGPVPDMIKIDAEGFDLRVLHGASKTLGFTDVILAEVAILPSMHNHYTAVCSFMDAAGYQLADVTDLNHSRQNGLLWLAEFAFVRRGSQILAGAADY